MAFLRLLKVSEVHMPLVPVSVVLFTVLAAVTVYTSIWRLLRIRWLFPSPAGASRLTKWIVWVLAVLASPFAWFLGFVGGGNYGGGLAASLAEKMNVGSAVAVPIGIGIGIFLLTTVLVIAVCLVGVLVGASIDRMRH